MRPRKQDHHLPACMYLKHGSYWLVKQRKWVNLGSDYSEALREYARLQAAPVVRKNNMAELIDKVLDVHGKSIAPSTLSQYKLAGERLKTILADTPTQCNRILSFLSVVFNYALEWQLIENHPCRGIRQYKERARTRYVSHDEFNALLAHLPEPMHNLFTLVYLTGQRIGDVLHLHQSNITENGIAFVQQKTQTKMLLHITEDIAEVLSRIQPSREGWLFYNTQGRRNRKACPRSRTKSRRYRRHHQPRPPRQSPNGRRRRRQKCPKARRSQKRQHHPHLLKRPQTHRSHRPNPTQETLKYQQSIRVCSRFT